MLMMRNVFHLLAKDSRKEAIALCGQASHAPPLFDALT
jgi:hypothetical protein